MMPPLPSAGLFLPLVFLLHFSAAPELLIFLAAVASHELGHLSALALCGYPARQLILTPAGAEIRTDNPWIPYKKEIFIALAGPCANALGLIWCLVEIRRLPNAALFYFFFCHALLLAANLFPIRGLDGYSVLHAALSLKSTEDDAAARLEPIHRGALLVLFLLGIGLTLFFRNASLLLLACSLLPKINIPP